MRPGTSSAFPPSPRPRWSRPGSRCATRSISSTSRGCRRSCRWRSTRFPRSRRWARARNRAAREGFRMPWAAALYRDNSRGQITGDLSGLVKLVFSASDLKLLGVHILGEMASELVHVGQGCLHFGGTIDYFIQSAFNHPTLAEAYKYAAYDGLGNL